MKTLLLILALSITSLGQSAQLKPQCTITSANAPIVRGFKLGQPFIGAAELVARPTFLRSAKANEVGLRRVYLTRIIVKDEGVLEGARSISLHYLDDQLSSIEVMYDSSVKWESDAHLASAVAKQLQLPTKGWTQSYAGPRLTCDGFFIEVKGADMGGWLKVERTGLTEEIEKRTAAYEQKRRVEFKP